MKPCTCIWMWIVGRVSMTVTVRQQRRIVADPWCEQHVTDQAPLDLDSIAWKDE